MWDWGSEQQVAIEKEKMKPIGTLGIFQAGILFELIVTVTLEDMGWILWQRQQKGTVPLGFWF